MIGHNLHHKVCSYPPILVCLPFQSSPEQNRVNANASHHAQQASMDRGALQLAYNFCFGLTTPWKQGLGSPTGATRSLSSAMDPFQRPLGEILAAIAV
mmetsp:Transcript_19/g.42  ORF Transcript_19/g.42 Transcript_19/m.42 type:complete len:98 (-) Transcript_19:771-1064(-)